MLENTHPAVTPDNTVNEAVLKLQSELTLDQAQRHGQSYVGRALNSVSQLFDHSGDTQTGVSSLLDEIHQAQKNGNSAEAERLAAGSSKVIEADQKAHSYDAATANYGGEFVGVASLFTGGKAGLVASALAYAANSAKPDESVGNQLADAGLGAAQGLVMKGTLDGLGRTNLGIAPKAVLTSISSRFSQTALNRETYIDKSTGNVDIGAGLEKVGAATLDPKSIATDAAIYGLGGLALGKLDSAAGGILTKNRLVGNLATGAVFGLAGGGVSEIQSQEKQGKGFDLGAVLKSGLLHAGVDGLAASAGTGVSVGFEHVNTGGERFGDHSTKPYAASFMDRNLHGLVWKPTDIELGDVTFKKTVDGKVVDAPEVRWPPPDMTAKDLQGPTVSELLSDPSVIDRMRVTYDRDFNAFANAMKPYKAGVSRFIDAGGDSVVFEMKNGSILKITDRPWRDFWGKRTYMGEDGRLHQMDAPILGSPHAIDLGDRTAMYYLQPKAQTPVTLEDLIKFKDNVAWDGEFRAWDISEDLFGQHQLGYLPSKGGVLRPYLLDYNAVVPIGEKTGVQSDGGDEDLPSWRRQDYADWLDR